MADEIGQRVDRIDHGGISLPLDGPVRNAYNFACSFAEHLIEAVKSCYPSARMGKYNFYGLTRGRVEYRYPALLITEGSISDSRDKRVYFDSRFDGDNKKLFELEGIVRAPEILAGIRIEPMCFIPILCSAEHEDYSRLREIFKSSLEGYLGMNKTPTL